jgi:Cu-Zn family superoxide dismutase
MASRPGTRALWMLATAIALSAGQALSADAPRASATLKPTQGNQTAGTATFTQEGDKVRVRATVTGLKPNQQHGFHVHEAGDCSAPDAMSAKGHFNPLNKPHGSHTVAQHHAGDMPNLRADAAGRAEVTFDLDGVTVADGPTSIVGRGLIVHAQPDDYTTQPTGNAGGRLACARIERG